MNFFLALVAEMQFESQRLQSSGSGLFSITIFMKCVLLVLFSYLVTQVANLHGIQSSLYCSCVKVQHFNTERAHDLHNHSQENVGNG